ncbi:HAD family hydrolase [Flavisphingomonas formosensis]|uniref:HAD family hydrolase n=1 Tax=Flavisphingomonas formosensis TaxID=861534 RepID=UPI0012FB9800|nr:HAD-IB family hydrolase [Sphingomonas formosensis]
MVDDGSYVLHCEEADTRFFEETPALCAAPAPVSVAVFDLDRTITRRGTWSPFLIAAARKRAPWRLLMVPAVIGAMGGYKLGLLSRQGLKQFMHHCMIGGTLDRAAVQRLSDDFADRVVAKEVRADALTQIRREQARGARVIVASAANCFYLRAIAARLGVDDVVGTESDWTGDCLRPKLSGENCYGKAKRDRVLAYLAAQGLDRSRIHIRFYSDDASDLPLFESVDEPIAVNPTSKLRAIAHLRGWPTLQWA